MSYDISLEACDAAFAAFVADRTLTVNPADRHSVFGPKRNALEHFATYGVALWVRASGKATLFYRDNEGRQRQRTWTSVRFKPDAQVVDVLNGALRNLATTQSRGA